MKTQSGSNIMIKKISDVIVLALVDVVNDRFQSAKYPILRKSCAQICRLYAISLRYYVLLNPKIDGIANKNRVKLW